LESFEKKIRFGCFMPIPATPVEKLFKIAARWIDPAIAFKNDSVL
jgi:hypothetical protein